MPTMRTASNHGFSRACRGSFGRFSPQAQGVQARQNLAGFAQFEECNDSANFRADYWNDIRGCFVKGSDRPAARP